MAIILLALALSAIYAGGAWLWLAVQSYRYQLDYERETFHLGLCFILSIGFLGLLIKGG